MNGFEVDDPGDGEVRVDVERGSFIGSLICGVTDDTPVAGELDRS